MLIVLATGWAATFVLSALLVRERRRHVVVARAAHEVRGPLCAARLGLETLLADPSRVAALDLELRRAARALDDLVSARPLQHPEPMDLATLARSCEPAWRAVAGAHGAQLRLETPEAREPALALFPAPHPASTAIFADPLRIAQACANLVVNAAEHGGGVVRIRVRALDDHVRFEVADGGPGLPAPVGALVVAARSRRSRRGHGLAVAAEIVESHGGRLASAPGARVVIELPAAAPAPVASRRAVAPPPIVA